MPSFDIAMKTDLQEVDNAINQARKEIAQRYDFRGSQCEITWDKKGEIGLLAEEDRLAPLLDVVQSKLHKRGVSIKNMTIGDKATAANSMFRQGITLATGVPKETGKDIAKAVKQSKLKVQAQIQEDQVRVSGKKRDDLQQVIAMVKAGDFGYDFQFINFRD